MCETMFHQLKQEGGGRPPIGSLLQGMESGTNYKESREKRLRTDCYSGKKVVIRGSKT